MPRRWILLALLLWAGAAAPARAVHASGTLPALTVGEGVVTFSLQGSLGQAQGQAKETVYYEDAETPRFKLSELIWDIEDVVLAGGAIAAQFGPRWRVQAGYWVGVTEGDGHMDDFDWMLGPDSGWTDWSLSETEVRDTYAFDLNAAYELYRQGGFSVSGVIGYRQDQWGWKDSFQRYIYSEFGFRDSEGDLDGENVINYEQQFRIPYAGLQLGLTTARSGLEVYLHYSPLVEGEDHDYHVFRETYFDGEASGGDYYGVGLRAGYRILSRLTTSVAAEWQVIPEMIGDSVASGPEGAESLPDSSGIANEWMMLSFSIGYDL